MHSSDDLYQHLVARLEPLARALIETTASHLCSEIDALLVRSGEAFNIALSAALSDVSIPGGADVEIGPIVVSAPRRRVVGVNPAAPPTQVAQRDPKPENPRVRPPANKGGKIICRSCGFVGGNARGCGRSHPTQPKAETSTSDDDSEGEPRAHRRPSRAIEPAQDLPVIPHAALVRMLVADRANNAVGDAGGLALRADRGPSLIGHTEERRELCLVHGWVGRVAFERDQHEMCALSLEGEPCSRCDGKRFTTGGMKTCGRCNGTGIEPSEGEAPVIQAPDRPVAVLSRPAQQSYTKDGVRVRAKRNAPRAKTIAVKRITKAMLLAGAIENPPTDVKRPTTRGECRDAPRPCPWVACKHHLYLDINPETGSIKINFPDVEPWELVESCSLDIAERGGLVLEDVAVLTNLTRERIRQVELKGLHAMKAAMPEDVR